MQELIGRQDEKKILRGLLKSDTPEMLAVVGRRRVGKTFLIQTVYENEICFALTGSQYSPLKEQLQNFAWQMEKYSGSKIPVAPPKNWAEAFNQLSKYIDSKKHKQKKVIFMDELPWLAAHKSGFLSALGYFWNTWASRKNIVIVICGSAASWMIKNVIHHKGGMHNRVTRFISLQPFTLNETLQYLQSRSVTLNLYQIVQLYMAMGGIPQYLKQVKPGLSAAQNIDEICFRKNGFLWDEFSKLYPALFDNASNHIDIIQALAAKWKGLTRKEVLAAIKIPDGGTVSKYLSELEQSGFITSYLPFGKTKKDKLFRLTDEYSLFYLKFIEKKRNQSWQKISQQQSWKSWAGFAFESLCLKHIGQIKKALGISGIQTDESSFVSKDSQNDIGFQIDMLIDRPDNSINLCEMKFYESEFTIEKSYADEIRERIAQFKALSKTKKQVFLTFITTYGIKQNLHSLGLCIIILIWKRYLKNNTNHR